MSLTELQAYNAMVEFLEDYWEKTKDPGVGSILSDMMFLEDGTTADSAMWYNWLEAIEKGKDIKKMLTFIEPEK